MLSNQPEEKRKWIHVRNFETNAHLALIALNALILHVANYVGVTLETFLQTQFRKIEPAAAQLSRVGGWEHDRPAASRHPVTVAAARISRVACGLRR